MEAKAVCFLCVLACAMLTSCAMSLPESPSGDTLDALADTAQALEKILDKLKVIIASDSGEGEDLESRRRRSIPGVHMPYMPRYGGRRRPGVYRSIYRPVGGRQGPRPNYSEY